MIAQRSIDEEFTRRQQEVLEAVLQLMVDEGDGFSLARVAQAASCSKETLYKWFGDRDGLLTATVRWQASRVHAGDFDSGQLDATLLRTRLEDFAANWLSVISSPTSIALNRVAVGQAGSGKSRLGAIVLANGRMAVADRLKPLLEAGRAAGLLAFDDTEDTFRTFLGLVGRDVQIRLLLGEGPLPDNEKIMADAERAADQFLALFGRGEGGMPNTGQAADHRLPAS
ncbi:TetR/AcrR family transcriptional regulator C-terminal domain-containing protein [Notoacmeibacter marinus]|uniref:TetR/AcrR family transcriptional regulator C-terminal domain-containing protein n=1 Tax=Notoacmeibacter marinus TaxID=1876515 RepID=UPI000DF1CDB4|nr:TetR/AcrR family transcriptional regulator C-terminal domain-containing protein [Notoacmeibacter marinus]